MRLKIVQIPFFSLLNIFLALTSLHCATACCARESFGPGVSVAQPRFTDPFGQVIEGTDKTITCYSVNVVPIPKLRFLWFIDDTPVNASYLSAIGSGNDVYANEVYFQQLLNYKFTWDQNGKILRCGCITLARKPTGEKNECSMEISVTYAPKATEERYKNVVLKSLGTTAIVAMNISASPEPKIFWTVGSKRVNATVKISDQKFQARLPKLVDGKDTYLCELVINAVEEADLHVSYKLNAENSLGTAQFERRLSLAP